MSFYSFLAFLFTSCTEKKNTWYFNVKDSEINEFDCNCDLWTRFVKEFFESNC